jgi:hypothetical protein
MVALTSAASRLGRAIAVSLLLFSLAAMIAPSRASADTTYSKGELEALAAPIALYPDQLLAKVLIASTYPLEIVEAARWAESNKGLSGAARESALQNQRWDDSVKGIAQVPAVLAMMNERLDWTQKLGNAFLAQEDQLFDAIQHLRREAQSSGTLKTTQQQTVTVVEEKVVIQPVEPETVYVPYYDTREAYGSWDYPSYPPYYWPPPYGYGYGAGWAALGFLTGVAIGGGWWNNHVDWHGGNVNINNNFNRNNFNNYNRNRVSHHNNRWNHNANHRRGVNYPNQNLRNQHGRGTDRGAAGRRDFRGRDGGRQAGNRPSTRPSQGAGNRGFDNRGNRGNRGGTRPSQGALDNRGSRGSGFDNRGGGYSNRGSGLSNRGYSNSYGNRGRGGGFDGIGHGSSTRSFSSRGNRSMGGSGYRGGGGGGFRGGGGGFRGGGGGRGGGGRRR